MLHEYAYPSIDTIPTSILVKLPTSAILIYKELSALAKISSNNGNKQTHIVPSLGHLARRTGYSIRTVHIAIHKLKTANLIDHIHRISHETGKRITNLYYLARKIGITMRNAYRHLKNILFQLNTGTNKYTNTIITANSASPILGGGERLAELKPPTTAPPKEKQYIGVFAYAKALENWLNQKN